MPSCAVGAVGWTIQGQGESVDVEKYLSLGGGGVVASDEFSVLEDDDERFYAIYRSICQMMKSKRIVVGLWS